MTTKRPTPATRRWFNTIPPTNTAIAIAGNKDNAMQIRNACPEDKLNWRDHLAVHPAAELFPLLSEKELKELAGDIQRNGLRAELVLWQPDDKSEPVLLDGRNRLDALALIGGLAINPLVGLPHRVITGGDPEKLVDGFNLWRRHLKPDERRALIARCIKATPEKSDRQIAETAKVSPTTVGTVRRTIESTVQSGQLRIGKDGKARKPARRTAKHKITKTESSPREPLARAVQDVGPTSTSELERLRARNEELEKQGAAPGNRKRCASLRD